MGITTREWRIDAAGRGIRITSYADREDLAIAAARRLQDRSDLRFIVVTSPNGAAVYVAENYAAGRDR